MCLHPARSAAEAGSPAAAAAAKTPAPGLQAGARRHFDSAIAHYRARRYREAIHEFELSIEQIPSPDVWFNIGRAHEQLGEFRLAASSYRRYLHDRGDAPDASELTAHIEALTRKAEAPATPQRKADLGSLAIDAEQPGALVLLDGRELGRAPVDRILEVSPGQHRLEATMQGFVPFRAHIEVQPGALSAAYVDLSPLTQRAASHPIATETWLALGASAAGVLASGAFGVLALSDRGRDDFKGSARWARASDWSLGGALVFGVTAAVLHFATGLRDDGPPGRR